MLAVLSFILFHVFFKKHILIPELICFDSVFHSTTSVFEFLFLSFLWLLIAWNVWMPIFVFHEEVSYFSPQYFVSLMWITETLKPNNYFWLVWWHSLHPNTLCFYCSNKIFKIRPQNQFYISPGIALYFRLFLKVS